MTAITVYDPAMCCSTGICGAEVDQRLVDLAADLDWLKAQGVAVRRFGLSREPMEFAANPVIRDLMQASEGDDLPAILVDGAMVSKARYPSRAELAGWVGLAAGASAIAEQRPEAAAVGRRVEEASALADLAGTPVPAAVTTSACCGTAREMPAADTGCCGGSAKSARREGKAGCC